MNQKPINNAIKSRLLSANVLPAVWPNVDPQESTDRPYIEVSFIDPVRLGPNIKGDRTRLVGRFSVVVVVDEGTGEDAAYDYANTVAELFPQGLRIQAASHLITIQQPAEIRSGFRSSPDWRVPVIVQYTATNK